jgi:hypothetical protein
MTGTTGESTRRAALHQLPFSGGDQSGQPLGGVGAGGPETLRGFLTAEQARLKLDDASFAALLGLDVAAWRAIATGGQGWPSTALARVLLRFPDAHPLAAEEVRRRAAPGDGWRWWHAA